MVFTIRLRQKTGILFLAKNRISLVKLIDILLKSSGMSLFLSDSFSEFFLYREYGVHYSL